MPKSNREEVLPKKLYEASSFSLSIDSIMNGPKAAKSQAIRAGTNGEGGGNSATPTMVSTKRSKFYFFDNFGSFAL